MAKPLVIEVGPHTHFSSSLPAGREQCGVPGLLEPGNERAAVGLWARTTGSTDAMLVSWASDACPSDSRIAIRLHPWHDPST